MQLSIADGVTNSEGIAVVREGVQLVLYHSDRDNDTLTKQRLTAGSGEVTAAAVDMTFGTGGVVVLNTGASLRGVEVDASRRVWVVGWGNSILYRVSSDGSTLSSTLVSPGATPMDIAIDENNLLITRYEEGIISSESGWAEGP